jgi:sterol desaturase/sphingolipid hydroxylase (fatty acid hydroxylase superfamily)
LRKLQAAKLLNPKSQNTNIKWFDKPFDRLTVLSSVEGLTTLSLVEGQITMTEIQNIKPVLVIEKLRFEIYLQFGAWYLEFCFFLVFKRLYFWEKRLIKSIRVF